MNSMRSLFRRAPVFLVMSLALSGCGIGVGSYFAPTAAVVNGAKIPESLISERLRQAMKSSPELADSVKGKTGIRARLTFQREILTDLIEETIVNQGATSLNVSVTSRQVDEQFSQIRAQFASEAAFEAELARLGFTHEQARRLLRAQILTQGVQTELAKEITASEEQLRKLYDQNKAAFDAEIRVAHIMVCGNADPTTLVCTAMPEDQAEAASIAKRARAGEDFAALAGNLSKDRGSASRGGELGWIRRNPQPSAFEDAAFALAVGGISDPVQTQRGWHVIKVLAKGRSFDDARGELEEQLVGESRAAVYQDWLTKELRSKADKIRVNQKFGRFDASSLTVVPLDEPSNA